MRRQHQSHIKFSMRTTLTILATTSSQLGTSEVTKKKYYDYKMTARTLPSVVCLTNFRPPQSNRLQTISERKNLSTNLEEYVGQRPNEVHPSPHPIRTIIQSLPLARPKMTQQTLRAPAMTQTTSVQTPKMTILYVISVFKLTKPTLPNQTGLRLVAREN